MPSVDVTQLARKLVALETSGASGAGGGLAAAVRGCERLRIPLSKLAGPMGFATLQERALALAKLQSPALAALRVRPDGCIETIDHASSTHPPKTGDDDEIGALLTAQLLSLLVTFIGEPLAMRLVQDAWPQLSPGDINPQDEAAP